MDLKISTIPQKTLKLIASHILNSLLCLILVLILSPITTKKAGAVIYTVVIVFITVINIYTSAWDVAKKDARNIRIINSHLKDGETKKIIRRFDGFFSSLLLTAVNLCLLGLYLYGFNMENPFKAITTLIFRAWQSPYILMLSRGGNSNSLVALVVCFVPMVFYSLGYYMGTKDMGRLDDLMYKLVYKSDKKNDKK